MVMERMGWTWHDLQSTPVSIVEHLIEQMEREAKQQKQHASLPRRMRR